MSFTIIKGSFRIDAGIPDGDSVRFMADDDGHFDLLRGSPVEFKTDGTVQLRYEGIDAIEKAAIQPYASDSRDKNFKFLREKADRFDEFPRGIILSRQTDINRRPVCFVFSGDYEASDGEHVFLTQEMLIASVNYKMILSGYAYPMYYETLFMELREPLSQAFLQAQGAKAGIHEADASTQGVSVTARNDLETIPPIYPKLWRRLEEYTRNHSSAEGFGDFLKRKSMDKLNTVSDSRFNISFDNVVEVEGTHVRLLYAPHDMVFKPA